MLKIPEVQICEIKMDKDTKTNKSKKFFNILHNKQRWHMHYGVTQVALSDFICTDANLQLFPPWSYVHHNIQ